MKLLFAILLGVIVSSAYGCAAGYSEQGEEPIIAQKAGAAVGAPTVLRPINVKGGIQLTWTLSPQDPGPVTGYEIVRADVFSGPYETVGTVEKGVYRFVDRTAKSEAIYFYKVRALAGSQASPFSQEAAVEVTGAP